MLTNAIGVSGGCAMFPDEKMVEELVLISDSPWCSKRNAQAEHRQRDKPAR